MPPPRRAKPLSKKAEKERSVLPRLRQGVELQKRRRFVEAEAIYQGVLREQPKHPDALHLMGSLALEARRFKIAADYFAKAVKQRPGQAAFKNSLGRALILAGKPEAAIAPLKQAAAARPDLLDPICNLGHAYKLLNKPEEARRRFEDAVARFPESVGALLGLGEALVELGDMAAASATFRKALAMEGASKIEKAQAFIGLAGALRFGPGDAEPDQMDALLEAGGLPDSVAGALCHAAGKAREQLRQDEAAFARFTQAKTLLGRGFAIDLHQRQYDRICALFTRDFFEQRRDHGLPSERPVFVLGVPRSGTTLVEQIAASHPKVAGVGEITTLRGIAVSIGYGSTDWEGFRDTIENLSPQESRALATRYLEAIDKRTSGEIRVVDKNTHNFELIWLIALLFPNARVVHCTRDPLDTCLSCFTQHFTEVHGYNSDLRTLGAYYREYHRLMTHWRAASPVNMVDFGYEALIEAQEARSRELIDFLGLDWDPACLNYHENKRVVLTPSRWQVRQPIYKGSVKRWKRYRAQLGPLIEALGDLADVSP